MELKKKPADYVDRFSLNCDDSFSFGIRLNYESIRLMTDFGNSDLIICSPLGLRTIIGNVTEKKSKKKNKSEFPAADFLANIEVLICDSCEVLQMQNWEHLEFILSCLNQIPKLIGNCDISRITNLSLDGNANRIRQILFFSEVIFPELNSTFRRFNSNVSGTAFLNWKHDGIFGEISNNCKLIFQKTPLTSFENSNAEKFEFFEQVILPKISNFSNLLLYVPSYFDFLKIRKILEKFEISFGHICEYTTRQDVIRDRKDFEKKIAKILIVTERRHFFFRARIAHVEHIIFFGLPIFPRFCSEMVAQIREKKRENSQIIFLYNSLDRFALDRIVGSERAEKMISSDKKTHLFIT